MERRQFQYEVKDEKTNQKMKLRSEMLLRFLKECYDLGFEENLPLFLNSSLKMTLKDGLAKEIAQ